MPNVIEEKNLIFAEVGQNSNKFYRLQLLDDDSILAVYGRVGITEQRTSYTGGRTFFEKQIRAKLKKGYTELKVVSGGSAVTTSTVANGDLGAIAKRQILKTSNPELDKLIDRLVKANIHKITSSTSLTYNNTTGLFQSPLGVVLPEAISDARNLLVTIKQRVEKGDYKSAEFITAVNGYLRLIPTRAGMRLRPEVIFPDDAAIQAQGDILDSLEASYKALQRPTPSSSSQNDEKVFDVELDILNDDSERQRISKWFHSSNHRIHGYGSVKIANFFKVKIKNNWDNFASSLGNVTEVFHSTSESNLLSILKSGLKVSPPSTTYLSGAMFDRGHYGAIDSSKSLQYTFGRFGGRVGESGWTFVAEFAMGNTFFIKTYGGTLAKGYDSIWAKANLTGLRFDELIVPTDRQCRLKYLLEVKK